MTKILFVTGGAGFSGHHFVEHILKNTDWNMICPVSFRHKGDSLRTQHLQDPRITWFAHDLTLPLGPRIAHKCKGKIFAIVNYASESHVDRSIESPVTFIENNVKLMLNLLEFSREIKPDKFVHIGTDEEYGAAAEGVNHAEWSTILPSSPYAASKAMQADAAVCYWRTYRVPVILTNTMNLVAERQDAEKFLPLLIKKISNDETVTIHGTKKYVGQRKYLHCRNQSDAILFILNNVMPCVFRDKGPVDRPERFNVVGDVELDNLTFAQKVAKIIGKPLKFKFVDFHHTRPGHDRRYSLDGSKLAAYGWKAPVSFEESLERTIKWTLAHPEWLV